ncbi:MAG: hypothetical protein LBV43_05240 [Prevotella sp.]|jgi:hypothetical protein|nr:hypothetical protein [Prevotella sp.]
MKHNEDSILVGKILENIPEKINPVDYLMEELNLSRDSVYRRINGKKSFTYHEIVKLSSILNFSLDEILYIHNNDFSEEFRKSSGTNIETSIYLMLKRFLALTERYVKASGDKEIVMSANRLPDMFMAKFDILFRFICYRWMHLMREFPLDYPFENFKLSKDITSVRNDLASHTNSLKNTTFIFDENLYLNVIKDIQYFYKRKLISENDFHVMKESLFSLVDWGKSVMLYDHLDRSAYFYLSTLNIISTSVYFKFDEVEQTDVWSFLPNPISLSDKIACATHIKWLYSLRRYSALVSGANENIVHDFFNRQYEYVENMDKIQL